MAEPDPPHAPRTALLLLAAGSLAGCWSAERHAADADREVYDIIQARRLELDQDGSFTINPPTGTLRDRILEGGIIEIPPLTLVDSLQIAAEANRDYQTQREALYLEALDLTLERWDFTVQETGTLGATILGTGGEGGPASASGSLGFSRLFGSGLRIISDIGIGLVKDLSNGSPWDATTNLGLTITQPILRGFGRTIVTEPLTQAERDVLYQARDYESFRRDLAVDVANRYFTTLFRYDQLENEQANFARRQALRERNEAFAEAGKISDIDVDQARQDELAARNRLVEARRSLQTGLDDFKFFLGLPVETPLRLDRDSIRQIEQWRGSGEEITEEVGIALALERRYDYLTTLDRVVDAERKSRVAADALRAGLDVTLEGDASSLDNKPLDYSGGNFDWILALDYDAPFNRLPERNAYRQALITLQASVRRAEQQADELVVDVRAAIRNLQAARATYEIQQNAVVLAERRVESSELSLEAGRAETRDVLESQNALIAAQNQASLSFTSYVLAVIALYRTMECLLIDESGIELVRAEPGDTLVEDEQPSRLP